MSRIRPPSVPPFPPLSFSFLSFCYVEPAAFPAIRSPGSFSPEIELQEVEATNAPNCSDRMQVTCSPSLSRATLQPGKDSGTPAVAETRFIPKMPFHFLRVPERTGRSILNASPLPKNRYEDVLREHDCVFVWPEGYKG